MSTAVIGQPVSRVDGRQKVTGSATYAAEFDAPRLAHAAIVRSTVANGRIASIDSAAAERAPGVFAVVTHRQRAEACLSRAQRRRGPGGRRTPARAPGRPGKSSGPADRPRDRRDSRTGEPCGDAGARHLCARNCETPTSPASSRLLPTQQKTDQGETRPPETRRGDPEGALASSRGQDRPDLRDPAREPQSHRDARHHRGVGWRSPDPVGQDAVGAQRRRTRSPPCSEFRPRTSASSHPSSAVPSALACAPGRM